MNKQNDCKWIIVVSFTTTSTFAAPTSLDLLVQHCILSAYYLSVFHFAIECSNFKFCRNTISLIMP